ncbi:MAG: hypothetical protein HYT42_01070 [Candidatus Sungbacteria bacterium]|nr:hypothetical protein [Candidatus Sungbacteria bacterium]
MSSFNFPVFKTKVEGVDQKFRLEDPADRKRYFEAKVGRELEKIRDYLRTGTFVGFLLGKKNSGKGTYARLFMEAVGGNRVAHISVGDIVRNAQQAAKDESKKKELVRFLEKRYRGFAKIEEIVEGVLNWSVTTLLATEAILALVEWEIDRLGHKALFIDGFPRNLDQVSLALYFRALMGYRDDPDFFIFIDVPEAVVDERIKYRVICPICGTPRSLKLLRTKEIGYDKTTDEFYLICDNPSCSGGRMAAKKGDELGIEAIRGRIEADDKVMRMLLRLEGVPKVFLRNSIPAAAAQEYVDDYEITPSYKYELNSAGKVKVIEEPWTVNDEDGQPSYSLLPAAVVVALVKQVAATLGL